MTGHYRTVEDLAVEHRAKAALRSLMAAGAEATPALRWGLRHADPVVRAGCCVVLDHFLDEAALPELMANLTHDDARVRQWAMHALACDRCKEGACRPAEDDVLPIAIRLLREDESRRVRAEAVQLLGRVAHRRADALAALIEARRGDPHPNVRKIAARLTPGGANYERLSGGQAALAKSSARKPFPRKRKRGSVAELASERT
jgi:HEAT repeat protein